MKSRFIPAIHTSEDGHDLYICLDTTKDTATQLIRGNLEYFSTYRKAWYRCQQLNRDIPMLEELNNIKP